MSEQEFYWDPRDEAMVPVTTRNVTARVRRWAERLAQRDDDIVAYGGHVLHTDGTVETFDEVTRRDALRAELQTAADRAARAAGH